MRERGAFEIDGVANTSTRVWDDLVCRVATPTKTIFNFVPLIAKDSGVTCSLDILFLRRDGAGGLLQHGRGGDIDNRIKVLFDALKMPEFDRDLKKCQPQPDEDPFFCLLADDRFIDHISLTTDRLLLPKEATVPCSNCGQSRQEKNTDVMLVIDVKTVVFNFKRTDVSLW